MNNHYVFVTVYDITNRESFGAIAKWFAERGTHVPESTVKIILGNKADKVRPRNIILYYFRADRYPT